jgi:hypothetical protein
MIRAAAIALLAVAATAAPIDNIDIPRMLECLAMKETGTGWNGRPGPCGELSRWQITETVWRQHMAPLPFRKARDPLLAKTCACMHLAWLSVQIERRHLPVTPGRLATVWHFGMSHAARSSEWGLEVANLYNDLPCPR